MCNYVFHPLKCSAGSAAKGIIGEIASAIQTAQADIIGTISSMWVDIPTPKLGSATTGNPVGPVAFLWEYTHWLTTFFAVLGLLIAAGRLAWERRGEPAKEALQGLVRLVIVTGCSVAAVTLATEFGDYFSTWILEKALKVDASGGTNLTDTGASQFSTAMKNLAVLSTSGLAAFLVIVMGLFGIISCIIQLILMLVRYAMLGLLVGTLPVAASLSGTENGKSMYKKAVGWLIAFVLYKPVAATIYAYAIVSMKQDDVTSVLAGLAMIIMAVAALPALMRFIVPAVSQTTGSGSGAGAALAGAGVATGARMIASRSGAGSASGGSDGGSAGGASGGGPTGSNKAAAGGGPSGGQGEEPTSSQGPSGGGSPSGGEGGQALAGSEGAASLPSGGPEGAGGGATAGAGAGGATGGATGGASVGGATGAGAASGAAGGAAAAAGPVGMGAGVALQKVNEAKQAAQGAIEGSAGEDGPSGA
ncbi:hypothetical protein ACIHFE_33740 [Streptomyces sp. NPDC052396]|uniref:hypothetical protein n=1 Tax=Streptomyces sp. NPDC052396 TaxID=3365689 RepID=UPI0037D0E6E8